MGSTLASHVPHKQSLVSTEVSYQSQKTKNKKKKIEKFHIATRWNTLFY